MKTTYLTKLMTVYWLSMLLLTSCSDWLDIQPQQEIKTKHLYTSEEGYKSALTGVYKLMTENALYGQALTYGYVSKLEQRYDRLGQEINLEREAELYDYKNNNTSSNTQSHIWEAMYNAIANDNNLLYYLNLQGNQYLSNELFSIIKGEALALRAYMYFDLLRMWGPIYSEDSQFPTVPWRDVLTSEKEPLCTAQELVDHIMADLKEAESLLAIDPICTGQDRSNPIIFLRNRQYRMNLYAVQALQARINLWIGNKEKAKMYAKEVIDHCGLSLVRSNSADPSMQAEALFMLDIFDLDTRVDNLFPADINRLNSPNSEALYLSLENAQEIFEVQSTGLNDIRYKNREGMVHAGSKVMPRKFIASVNGQTTRNMPLIRLAEMYLIMAETDIPEQSVTYLNTLRHARGIAAKHDVVYDDTYTENTRMQLVGMEYQKEFLCEGQWFYFLKRTDSETFFKCPVTSMKGYYVFPIPDNEIEHGLGQR